MLGLSSFNPKLLQAFVLVAENRSFRKAAELTAKSQSAVSAQVKELERQLGLALLHRTTRSVALTPEGEELLTGARRALQEIEHSLRVVRESAEIRHGRVVLGCAPSIAVSLAPGILSSFGQDFPNVKVFLRETASDELLVALRDGSIDFAIAQAVPPEPDLAIEMLLKDPIVALAPRTIVPSPRDSISLEELSVLPLLHLAPSTSLRQLFDAEMRKRGLPTPCKYDCLHSLTLIAMAEAGLGIAILPRSVLRFASSPNSIAIKIRPASLARDIALISRSDRALPPAAKRLADLARESVAHLANARSEDQPPSGSSRSRRPRPSACSGPRGRAGASNSGARAT
jgi:DNA-binding transcriptional LysR family regulator